jgi:hypothetical protein
VLRSLSAPQGAFAVVLAGHLIKKRRWANPAGALLIEETDKCSTEQGGNGCLRRMADAGALRNEMNEVIKHVSSPVFVQHNTEWHQPVKMQSRRKNAIAFTTAAGFF